MFPTQPVHISLYLQQLIETADSKAPIDDAVNSLKWAHHIAGLPSPTEAPLVQAVQAGAHRILANPRMKKELITPEILNKLAKTFAGPMATLTDIRTLSLCLLGYSGFFRFDDLAHIRPADITTFQEDHMSVRTRSTKTDQFRQGNQVLIVKTGTATCPVGMTRRYLSMANEPLESQELLFCAIVKTKKGETLRASGGISYTSMREVVLEQLRSIGLDTKQFGIHSLRAGGATAVVQAGIDDRLFKRYGRWRSESAKDGYVKDAKSDLLSVSKSLGI